MENLLKDMGKRIFDRRKQLNMTQETLAELAHVTPQTISTAELGQKAMRPETILKVCDALHISTEYLLRGVITEADSSLLTAMLITIIAPPDIFDEIHIHLAAAVTTKRAIHIYTVCLSASDS